MSHYLFASSDIRPLTPHGFTVSSLLCKRLVENTTPVALSYNFLVPFLVHVNTRLEEHIKETEQNGNIVEDMWTDVTEAFRVASARFGDSAGRVIVTSSLSALLVYRDLPLGCSIVQAFDSYQRLHHEYYGRVLAVMRLPTAWARIIGPAARTEDIQHFEHRPISVAAAMEDSLKRQCLTAVAELTVGTTVVVIRSRLAAKDDAPLLSVARGVAFHTSSVAARLTGAACGAALGSRVGRGGWEYWGECIGMLASTMTLTLLYKRKVEAAERAQHLPPACGN